MTVSIECYDVDQKVYKGSFLIEEENPDTETLLYRSYRLMEDLCKDPCEIIIRMDGNLTFIIDRSARTENGWSLQVQKDSDIRYYEFDRTDLYGVYASIFRGIYLEMGVK